MTLWRGVTVLIVCLLSGLGLALGPGPTPGAPVVFSEREFEGRVLSLDDQGYAWVQPDGRREGVSASIGTRLLSEIAVGDRVRVDGRVASNGRAVYVVQDFVRRPTLYALGALFTLVAVAVGRWKGLRAVAGMFLSLGVILLGVVPAILAGWNPVLVALLGSVGILLFSVYFVHGLNWTTTAALIGTVLTSALAIGLSALAIRLARLDGASGHEAAFLSQLGVNVDLRALLLGGIIIGALGALVDSTVPQAAVVRELAHLQPQQSWRELYSASMRVGIDHIGSLINTLVLAYAGSSLPLFVVLTLNAQSLGSVLNSQLIVSAAVQALVGSIGLMLAVPVTSLLAALAFQGSRLPAPKHAELHHHHHH